MKNFNTVINEAKAKVYSNSVNALVLMAKGVAGVEFSPILAPNGVADGSTTSNYNVQRRKRFKSVAVANVNTGTTSAALALLDQMPKSDWETLEVATGALQMVGIRKTLNDDFDFTDTPQHERDLYYQVGEVARTRHKNILTLLGTAKKTGGALPAMVKDDTVVWNAIADEVIKLAALDDDFLDVQGLSDFYIVTSHKVAKELAQEMGKVFHQEAAIAQTGFKSSMSINGTPVIVDARLTGREVYVAHNDAVAFGKKAIEKKIQVDLGLVEFTGIVFYDIMTIVDKDRITQFGA